MHRSAPAPAEPVPPDDPPRRLRAVRDVPGQAASPATATKFSEAVRLVVGLSRRRRLRPPVFRSPPRVDGVDRTIRRRPTGVVVVSVRREGRPLAAVQGDVIEGVVVANRLSGEAADAFRREAWTLLDGGEAPGRRRASMDARPSARVA